MQAQPGAELTLIRHAPVQGDGRVYGRRDLPADCSNKAGFDALRAMLSRPERLIASPAQRCLQTSAQLWPDLTPETHADLWEQSFGAWEGLPFGDIPDIGPLSGDLLAEHRPPEGESFADICARISPILNDIAMRGPATIVAHAGTVRAALALAIGTVAPALSFDVKPLSVTRITLLPGGQFVIGGVNQCATAP